MLRVLPFGKEPSTQQKVGSIGADGSFNLERPNAVTVENKITDYRLFTCQYVEAPTEIQYSDPKAKVRSPGISVIKNGKSIGTILLATSREMVYNHSPYGECQGELGYRLDWWYGDRPTSVNVICDRKMDNYGGEIEISNIYDLNFKKG